MWDTLRGVELNTMTHKEFAVGVLLDKTLLEIMIYRSKQMIGTLQRLYFMNI